jgi:hypothetical protein
MGWVLSSSRYALAQLPPDLMADYTRGLNVCALRTVARIEFAPVTEL